MCDYLGPLAGRRQAEERAGLIQGRSFYRFGECTQGFHKFGECMQAVLGILLSVCIGREIGRPERLFLVEHALACSRNGQFLGENCATNADVPEMESVRDIVESAKDERPKP